MAGLSPVWGLNENGEIVAVAGTGSTNIVGFLNEDALPVDSNGRVVIAGLGGGGGSGTNGKSVLNGTGAPSNAVGTNGDFYIDTVAVKIYGPKASGAWPAGVNLVGPSGKSVLNGTGAPSSAIGTDGDFYIDTSATVMYGPKASGAWPAGVSLVGSGGGGGSGLPTVSGQVNLSITTNKNNSSAAPPTAQSDFVTFPSQACTELIVTNRSSAEIEYNRNGGTAVITIKPGVTRRIAGITDASQIGFRRTDWAESNTFPELGNRVTGVTATAQTNTETFVVAGIQNLSVTNGGGGNSPGSMPCTAAEIINNTGKNYVYRVGSSTVNVIVPSGGSEVVLGITNTSQLTIKPADQVSDTGRTIQIEAFTSGLRERMNLTQPQQMLTSNARVMLGEMQYPNSQPTSPNMTIAEVARGPRRTLTPPRVIPLAQFSTVANMAGSTANCIDATDGERYLGTTQVEFTQTTNGTFNFMPTVQLSPGINVTDGIIRFTVSFPKGTPDYAVSQGLTALRIQLFSSGTHTAVPSDYHQSGVSNASTSVGKRVYSYSMDISSFVAVGAGADLTGITWARFQLAGSGYANGAKFRPVSIDFVPKTLSKAIIIFSVDDFHTGAYTGLLPMLSKYGYPGVLFGDSVTKIGNAGNLSADQIRILHQYYGWQVANQNFNSETSTYYSSEQFLQEHSKYALMMQALGIGDLEDTSQGSGQDSGGAYLNNVREDNAPAMKRAFRSMTLFLNGSNSGNPFQFGETAPFGDPYGIRRLNVSSWGSQPAGSFTGTPLAQWKLHVDQAVNTKGVAIFGAHNEFNAANIATEVGATFPQLIEYIRQYELQDKLEVLTIARAIDKIYKRT